MSFQENLYNKFEYHYSKLVHIALFEFHFQPVKTRYNQTTS